MSVAGIIFLAKLHAYRAAVARGETEQAAVRFAAEAEYAEDKRLEDRLALFDELVKALKDLRLSTGMINCWCLGGDEEAEHDVACNQARAVFAKAEAIEKGE